MLYGLIMTSTPLYKRVLLKVSGEALMGKRDYGLDTETVNAIAAAISSVALPVPPVGWTAPRPITWACWPP